MRVLFDAYWWVSGPTSNAEVMREIFASWVRQYPDELVLFVRHADREVVRTEASRIAGRPVSVVASRLGPHGLAVLVSMQWYARTGSFDAVFTQNFAIRHRRSYVFIHDVLFLTNPEWFSRLERAYFRLMPWTARRARVVLTSSQSEARRIKRNVGCKSVVPVGLGARRRMVDAEPVAPPAGLRPGSFALTVGRFNVRKNLARVAAAAAGSRAVTKQKPLVLVGDEIPDTNTQTPVIRSAIQRGELRSLGFVSDGELRWLYENCAVFIMASMGEGFGMPVAEAATFNKPAVVSDLEVFREITSDAYFVDPMSTASVRDGIDQAFAELKPSTLVEPLEWFAVGTRIRTLVEGDIS